MIGEVGGLWLFDRAVTVGVLVVLEIGFANEIDYRVRASTMLKLFYFNHVSYTDIFSSKVYFFWTSLKVF
jgi:hypothetical protein